MTMTAINLPQRAWFLLLHPRPEHPKWRAAVMRLLTDLASVLDDETVRAEAHPCNWLAVRATVTEPPPTAPDPDVLEPHLWAMGEPQPGTLVHLHAVWRTHPVLDTGPVGSVLAGPFPDGEVLVRWSGNPEPYVEAVARDRLWEVSQ